MKKFCLVRNQDKDIDGRVAEAIVRQIESRGGRASVSLEGEAIDASAEAILVLGGDGTLLRAAKKAVADQIPLLGINLGTLGYLAEVNRDNIEAAVESLLDDEFTIERRMMLDGTVYRQGKKLFNDVALNDIVITHEGPPHVIRFKNYVNGEFLNEYSADGIILATPTGSTGYSLSAGGPIISPTAGMIMMTALAPHTINTRSIIFSKTDRILVELEERSGKPGEAKVYYDGGAGFPIGTGDTVLVRKSALATNIIKIRQVSFLEALRSKLSNS